MHEEESSVAALLASAVVRLGADMRLEAELLLAHALDRPRAWLFAHAHDVVADTARRCFDLLVVRRAQGEPIAQLVGSRGFWSLDLHITPDVLIPRAETELLVECALGVLATDIPVRVADLGTGSGAVALAIARERPLAEVIAVDVSPAALAVAQWNAVALGFVGRVHCAEGDWLASLHGQCFDAIVSNPPYIADDDPHLREGDLRYEPRIALASGPDGLDAIRSIVRDAPAHLAAGGWLLIEHGWEQGNAVRGLFVEAGFEEVATHRDLESRERVTCGRWGVARSA